MQISPINNTNFTALRSIKVEGAEFRRRPEFATSILEKVKSNKTITDFLNRWDTSILLKSSNLDAKKVAGIAIFYKEKNTGNFFKDLFNRLKESKYIDQTDYDYDFKEAVSNLIKRLDNGGLISQINYINEKADVNLAEKKAKKVKETKIDNINVTTESKRLLEQSRLDKMIEDMTK